MSTPARKRGRPPREPVCPPSPDTGNAAQIAERLLKKRPDLLERVAAGEISQHAAAAAAQREAVLDWFRRELAWLRACTGPS